MKPQDFPRNGQYEIYTTNGRTYCFDDVSFTHVPTPADMFEWIRSHDPSLWRPSAVDHASNIALYLKPELYLLWKLKYT